MALSDDIADVLEKRLGRLPAGTAPRGFERLRHVARLMGVQGRSSAELPSEVIELAELLGIDLVELDAGASALRRIAGSIQFREEHLPTLGQAYARGITRIVTAEAEALRIVLSETVPHERARVLDSTLNAVLPLEDRAFAVLHRLLLREALSVSLDERRLAEPAVAPVAIAHVDVVGSTEYLQDAAPGDTELLVDVLFAAAQSATLGGATAVVKYVGDGVFLAGPDVGDAAAAALDTIAEIQSALPVQARSGIAYGPVVRRAGDYFGLPVSLAELLTKAAEPGGLLATKEAAKRMGAELETEKVRVKMPRSRRRVDAYRVGGGTPPESVPESASAAPAPAPAPAPAAGAMSDDGPTAATAPTAAMRSIPPNGPEHAANDHEQAGTEPDHGNTSG